MTLSHVLVLSAALLVTGIAGLVLDRKNIILMLMCLELMLLATSLNLVGVSYFRAELTGQIFSFFILTVAAAELAIGLAIVTLFYRNRGSIEVDQAGMMKG